MQLEKINSQRAMASVIAKLGISARNTYPHFISVKADFKFGGFYRKSGKEKPGSYFEYPAILQNSSLFLLDNGTRDLSDIITMPPSVLKN